MIIAQGGIFSLNVGLVLWTFLLFGLTLAILWWKAFPAIAGGLEQRHQKIQAAIDDAKAAREEAQEQAARQAEALSEARRESQALLQEAKEAADRLRADILDEASRVQTRILEDARREIALERDRLREEVRKEAVDVALAASERLLMTRLDGEENRRLVEQFMVRM